MNELQIFNELSEHIHLRINSCREERHDGSWFERKVHTDYDLWLLVSGKVHVATDGGECTAKPGDVIFFYPDLPYTATTESDGCCFIYIHFDFGIGDRYRILDDFPLAGVIDGEPLIEELTSIIAAFQRLQMNASMSGFRLKGALTTLLSKVIELYGDRQYEGKFRNIKAKTATQRLKEYNVAALRPVLEYVESHLHEAIRMKELAHLAGVSEKYFITIFKTTLGITPGQYMYQLRMNRARDFLHQRKYSIKEIAGFLGYPDPYSFSKAFKKYYHIQPSKFV
jgi:AraC family transcriptional regulator